MSETLDMHDIIAVQLDPYGNGIARKGPQTGTHWLIQGCSVAVSTNGLEAKCYVYKTFQGPNLPLPHQQVGSTVVGSTGTSFGPGITIYPGHELAAIWSAGDPFSTATLTFWGSKVIE